MSPILRQRRSSSASARSVRSEYDRLAPFYEHRWPRYVEDTTRETLARIPLEGADTLLDVGCGTGFLLDRLATQAPSAHLYGTDLSVGMLKRARERLGERGLLVQAEAERLPFAGASADRVLSVSAFHFFPDPVESASELYRVLRRGGVLVLTDWCHDFLFCRLCDRFLELTDPAHHRIHTSAEIHSYLEKAGFAGIRIERYRSGWIWGLMTVMAYRP